MSLRPSVRRLLPHGDTGPDLAGSGGHGDPAPGEHTVRAVRHWSCSVASGQGQVNPSCPDVEAECSCGPSVVALGAPRGVATTATRATPAWLAAGRGTTFLSPQWPVVSLTPCFVQSSPTLTTKLTYWGPCRSPRRTGSSRRQAGSKVLRAPRVWNTVRLAAHARAPLQSEGGDKGLEPSVWRRLGEARGQQGCPVGRGFTRDSGLFLIHRTYMSTHGKQKYVCHHVNRFSMFLKEMSKHTRTV